MLSILLAILKGTNIILFFFKYFNFFFFCSLAVWTSLAKMCVKTKRLDVAEICLGQMKDCRGLAILRSVNKEDELDARVACLAVHLGMHVSMHFILLVF